MTVDETRAFGIVGVGVSVGGAGVGDNVGVPVGIGDGVNVSVGIGVSVGMSVGVKVLRDVFVGVGVGLGARTKKDPAEQAKLDSNNTILIILYTLCEGYIRYVLTPSYTQLDKF